MVLMKFLKDEGILLKDYVTETLPEFLACGFWAQDYDISSFQLAGPTLWTADLPVVKDCMSQF